MPEEFQREAANVETVQINIGHVSRGDELDGKRANQDGQSTAGVLVLLLKVRNAKFVFDINVCSV